MCGRVACALCTDDLACATSTKSDNVYIKSKIHKSSRKITPSYNVPPTASLPVLVSARHKCFKTEDIEGDDSDYLLVGMRLGIVPPWLKADDVKNYNNETHLSKVERIKESKLYKPLYDKGLRCALPCLGYYEWQSTNSSKQPYFFYHKDNKVSDLSSTGIFDLYDGWKGVHLLYLAGLFNEYKCNGETAYSFAIITQESNSEWKWLHHRMPVVLQTQSDVHNWINTNESPFQILKQPIKNLAAHPVDRTIVNKCKNNLPECIVPIQLNKPVNKLMASWLSQASNKSKEQPSTNTNKNKKRSLMDEWLSSENKKPKTD